MSSRPCLALLGISLLASACADRNNGSVGGTAPSDLRVPSFASRIEVGTQAQTHFDGALADFDGDGQEDLLVVGIEGAIQLLRGDENAGFIPDAGGPVQVLGGPSTILALDLDRDLDQDAVVLGSDGVMTLFLNDGSGSFTAGDTFPIGVTALCVVSDDIDGDGIADVVVSRRFAPEILVFSGTGTGTLNAGVSLFLPTAPGGPASPIQMALGDVAGDAAQDLVICDEALDRVIIYEGQLASTQVVGGGSAQLTANLLGTVPTVLNVPGAPSAVTIADLSGDGANDMVISAFAGQRIEVITSFNEFSFASSSLSVPLSPGITAVEDFTGDGVPDLAVSLLFQEGVSIFPGNGAGGFEQDLIYDTLGNPLRLLPSDLNNDGAMDLVAISAREDSINVLLGAPDYGLEAQRQHPISIGGGEGLARADLDGDGDDELLVSTVDDTRLVALSATDTQTRYDMTEFLIRDFGVPVFNVLAQDMDNDGAADLVVSTANGVEVLRNTGFGTGVLAFDVTGASINVGPGFFGIDVADMNGDGLQDLVLANGPQNRVSVVFGAIEPFVFDNTPQDVTVNGFPLDVVAADITGDGLPEVAVTRRDDAFVTLLLNTGGGNLQPALDIPVGAEPYLLADADYNRDGRIDLVVSNRGDNTVQMIVADANQVFRSPTFAAGQLPVAVAAGDVNNDGNPDLVVAGQGDDSLRIMLGNGNGEFPLVLPLPGSANTVRAVLADTDGDGDVDIALSNQDLGWITHLRSRLADNGEL